jgi:hypothetical protein
MEVGGDDVDAYACAFWYGSGGEVVEWRGFDLDPGTPWYFRDRETALITGRGVVAMACDAHGETGPAIFVTDAGWERLWDGVPGVFDGLRYLLGAGTRERAGKIDRALGVGKRHVGAVILIDLELLAPSARFDADDLLCEAGTTQNPFRIADRQDIAARFEEARERA